MIEKSTFWKPRPSIGCMDCCIYLCTAPWLKGLKGKLPPVYIQIFKALVSNKIKLKLVFYLVYLLPKKTSVKCISYETKQQNK